MTLAVYRRQEKRRECETYVGMSSSPISHPSRLLTWPRPLPPGGTIGICSPSSPSLPESIAGGVRALEARGYRVVTTPHVAATNADLPYLAGGDSLRTDDLNALLRDPTVDMVLCARGGYGAGRLLDRLDYEAIRRDPKPLVGYSDITALSLAIAARAEVVSFSGIMATSPRDIGGAELDSFSEASLWQAVGDTPFPRVLTHPEDFAPWRALGEKAPATGPVYAVCLSLLVSLLGTPYVPDLRGAILLIEDVGEDLYRIDRMLTQLRLAGILDNLAALLLGTFNGKGEDEDARLVRAVPQMARALTNESVPVASGLAYGHIPRRWAVPCGAVGTVDFARQTLTFSA